MAQAEKVCLIIGANGFVGSYLVDVMAAHKGMRVRAFDRFSSGPRFQTVSNIEIVQGDYFKDGDIKTALVGASYVLHCFSATTPFIADGNPMLDLRNNLLRNVQVFEMCVAEKILKLGFISSGGAVYGGKAEEQEVDEDSLAGPVSPYGINKLATEHYLEYFRRKHAMDYVIYRLTNPYGPRQVMKHYQGVIPGFLNHIKAGEAIPMYGDGTSTRDYIYVEDAARMICDSFDSSNKHAIYNIGSGVQTSLRDIVTELETILQKPIDVVTNPTPKTFVHHTRVSVGRYEQEYGKVAFTSLRQGLKATVHAHGAVA